MRFRANRGHESFALFLCLILASSLIPIQASAEVKSRVQVQIGKPSVWSLAQAHYLLAKMHKDNRNLATRMPTEKELDPNAINTTRIQLLRTLLDIEGQANQKVGAENRSNLREEEFALRRREEALAELAEKETQLERVNGDLRRLKRTQARKQAEFDQIEVERLAQAKPDADPPVEAPLPDEQQKELQKDIKELNARIANKEAEKKDLEEEIGIAQAQAAAPAAGAGGSGSTQSSASNASSLRARANASVAAPTLSEVQLGAGGALPDFNTSIRDIITSAMRDTGKPSLAASIALDNFVGMQYEIIAKRLTLLRDEVGPDERVIFLELPSSIYTVPCKGDDYIVQVQWKVNWYYDDRQAEASMMDENKEIHTNIEDVLNNRIELTKRLGELRKQLADLEDEKNKRNKRKSAELLEAEKRLLKLQITSVERELSAITQKVDEEKWKPAVTSNVRALDVIPRQSALNINDVQATVSQKNFLGVLKLLFGLGIRVSYQRQRELYEQYLQQEVFASGFGKGSNAFGWTFGPLPGTNRVAPGVRTTYAVLAVPRWASALRVEATGVAYHRKSAPAYELDERRYDPDSKQILDDQQFIIRIPNEHTEQFKVMSVAYSPARAGEPVTVIIKGDYFSPQIGVLVDGVALNRSLSVGNNEISDAGLDNPATSGVRGQYELVSSREIVMKFSMGNDKYFGTPNITLITPEKSTAINYLPLQVNYRYPRISLRALASLEPMFIEPFKLTKTLDPSPDGEFVKTRLTGEGLRSKATISVGDHDIPIFKDRKWRLIKEATDAYIEKAASHPDMLKEALYELFKNLPEAGRGHVDQLVAEQIASSYTGKEGELATIIKVSSLKKPLDKDTNYLIFKVFLEHRKDEFKKAAKKLYDERPELHEEFAREILIRKFAEEYAVRICLKNGVRGNECTDASKRKVMQRRMEELLNDNVDPFNQDEPYHNEELYRELKDKLVQDLILSRKKLVKEKIAEVRQREPSLSEATALGKVRESLVQSYATDHPDACKGVKEGEEKKKCIIKLLSDYETLYQQIKKQYLQTGISIMPSPVDRVSELSRTFTPPPDFDEAKARQDALKEVEELYEKPGPNEEYAMQESTKAYAVRFRGSVAKIDLRYRHKTSSGFEVDAVTHKKNDSAYTVVRYIPDVGGGKALVDVRFTVEKDKEPIILVIDDRDARPANSPIKEKPEAWRVSFFVKHQSVGRGKFVERERFWVELTETNKLNAAGQSSAPNPGQTQAAGQSPKNLDIVIPIKPRVLRIVNSRSGKPEGYASEQPLITIHGYNLQTITKVLFADKEATLVGTADYNSLVIKAPKADPVAKGEAVEVPVLLVSGDGSQVASPIFYTYLGPPSPVVIYRPRRGNQAGRQYERSEDESEAYAEVGSDSYDEPQTRPRRATRRRQR